MNGYLHLHPHMLTAGAIALGVVLAGVVGFLFHWFVVSAAYWPLVGREWRAERSVQLDAEAVAQDRGFRRELASAWEDLAPDAQADQLIAEWHDDGPSTVQTAMAGWWEDPDIIEWDIRQQVRRIREIRRELADLRIELLAA